MTDDLVKRLRSKNCCDATKCNCDEAANRIEQLEAALRPFAELGEVWLPEDDKDDSIWVTCPDDTPVNNLTNFGFNFGHFRAAARAALREKKDD